MEKNTFGDYQLHKLNNISYSFTTGTHALARNFNKLP